MEATLINAAHAVLESLSGQLAQTAEERRALASLDAEAILAAARVHLTAADELDRRVTALHEALRPLTGDATTGAAAELTRLGLHEAARLIEEVRARGRELAAQNDLNRALAVRSLELTRAYAAAVSGSTGGYSKRGQLTSSGGDRSTSWRG